MLLLSSITSAICQNTGFSSNHEYYSIVMLAVNQIAMILVIFGYTKFAKINFLEANNLKKAPTVKQSITVVGIAISAMLAFLPIAYLFVYLLELGGFRETSAIVIPSGAGGVISGLIFAVILPAFLEELLYRGAVLGGLKQKSYVSAVILTSLIFSLAHGNATQTVHQFLASTVFCLIVLYGGSVWYGIIAHLTNNLISLIFNYIPLNLEGLGYYNILLGVMCFIVGVSLLAILMRTFKQQCKDRQRDMDVIDVYPNGKFRYIISSIIETITKFFRCIANKEDRKACFSNFERETGELDNEYYEQRSVFGKVEGTSMIVIAVVVVLFVMWLVSLIRGF